MRLTVIIQQDEDGRFNASCPEFVGCASWGLTYEDALKNIKEAIELYLEDIPKSELKKHISKIKKYILGIIMIIMICIIGCSNIKSTKITERNREKVFEKVSKSYLSEKEKELFVNALSRETYPKIYFPTDESWADYLGVKTVSEDTFTLIGKTVGQIIQEQNDFEAKIKIEWEVKKQAEERHKQVVEDYITNHIVIKNTALRQYDSFISSKYIVGEIKNNGDKTILDIDITIYLLDEDNKPVHEENFTLYAIKPNYTQEFTEEVYYASSDWSKRFELKITDIHFS